MKVRLHLRLHTWAWDWDTMAFDDRLAFFLDWDMVGALACAIGIR
jgi:hypothetical protein